MSKQETVEVTVKLPKAVVDFLKAMGKNVEEYICHNVVDCVMADLEYDHPRSSIPEELMEKHNLKPIFKEFGVLPCYYEH